MAKDMLGKAANKVGEVAGQAVATAAQWYRLDSEQRQLAKLRAQALQLRAQIGEEMYKLWRAQALPPSSLDALFRDIDRTMTLIDAQRERVEELRAHFVGGEETAPPADPVMILDQDSHLQVVEQPPPPVPAAPTRRLAAHVDADAADAAAAAPCPRCGRPGPAGKAFCGYCGARL